MAATVPGAAPKSSRSWKDMVAQKDDDGNGGIGRDWGGEIDAAIDLLTKLLGRSVQSAKVPALGGEPLGRSSKRCNIAK